jgi:hypothetical protein
LPVFGDDRGTCGAKVSLSSSIIREVQESRKIELAHTVLAIPGTFNRELMRLLFPIRGQQLIQIQQAGKGIRGSGFEESIPSPESPNTAMVFVSEP